MSNHPRKTCPPAASKVTHFPTQAPQNKTLNSKQLDDDATLHAPPQPRAKVIVINATHTLTIKYEDFTVVVLVLWLNRKRDLSLARASKG